MKKEIKRKIGLLRDQLNTKECELLKEVDRLGDLQVRFLIYLQVRLLIIKLFNII